MHTNKFISGAKPMQEYFYIICNTDSKYEYCFICLKFIKKSCKNHKRLSRYLKYYKKNRKKSCNKTTFGCEYLLTDWHRGPNWGRQVVHDLVTVPHHRSGSRKYYHRRHSDSHARSASAPVKTDHSTSGQLDWSLRTIMTTGNVCMMGWF